MENEFQGTNLDLGAAFSSSNFRFRNKTHINGFGICFFYGASLSVKHMDALSEPILQGKQAINQATLQG